MSKYFTVYFLVSILCFCVCGVFAMQQDESEEQNFYFRMRSRLTPLDLLWKKDSSPQNEKDDIGKTEEPLERIGLYRPRNWIYSECPDCESNAREFWKKHRIGNRFFSGTRVTFESVLSGGKPRKCFSCGTNEFFTEDIPVWFQNLPVIRGCVQTGRAINTSEEVQGIQQIRDDLIVHGPTIIIGTTVIIRGLTK